MQRMGFLVYPGFQIMALAAASVFEFANLTLRRTNYEAAFVSEHGGPIASSLGAAVQTVAIGKQRFDTLLIGAGVGVPSVPDSLIEIVRRAPRTSRRVARQPLG